MTDTLIIALVTAGTTAITTGIPAILMAYAGYKQSIKNGLVSAENARKADVLIDKSDALHSKVAELTVQKPPPSLSRE